MKKGFTLIEMLGVIILLTVIMVVVAPSLIGTLQNTDNKRWDAFKSNLKLATENYIVDHKELSSDSVSVNLDDLLNENYIEEIPSIPKDDSFFSSEILPENTYVKATKKTNGYSYELCKPDNSCIEL